MSKEKCWLQRNWKNFLQIIGGIIGGYLLTVGTAFFSISILNKEALQTLIEAEATVLGFFGLIVVYILKSLDEKEDRYEQQTFEVVEKDIPEMDLGELKLTLKRMKIKDLKEIREALKEKRTKILRKASLIGTFLLLSILFSIFFLGTMDLSLQNLSNPLGISIMFIGVFGVYLFLLSVFELLKLFRQIGS